MQRTWKEAGLHLKPASILPYIPNSFKVKCAKNLYRDVSSGMLLTLKGFFYFKITVDLDVNIALSKYGFNGVASFEIVRFGLRKQYF